MTKVSQEFDKRSKNYNYIYNSKSKVLLHQEKKIRSNIVEDYIKKNITFTHKDLILDIGCGTGKILLNLKKRKIKAKMCGIDISNNMIELAKKNLNELNLNEIDFKTGDMELILKKAKTVMSIGVIGYQRNQNEFIERLCNLVELNGYLIFTTGNGNSILRLIRQYISKLYWFLFRKQNKIKFLSIKDQQVNKILKQKNFQLEKKFYITFGLGLFPSSFECKIDSLFNKFLIRNKLGKFLSLTVIYIFKKNNLDKV